MGLRSVFVSIYNIFSVTLDNITLSSDSGIYSKDLRMNIIGQQLQTSPFENEAMSVSK